MKPPSRIAFPANFPSSVNKPSKLLLTEDPQADLASPTHQTFYLLCRVQIYLLVHIPPQKGSMVQTTTLIWVLFLQLTHQLLIMNPPPPVKYLDKKKQSRQGLATDP